MRNTEENRKRLLNLSAGGNGHLSQWVEHVIFEATEDSEEHDGYILHTESRTNGKEMQIRSSKHVAQLLTMITDEAAPTDAEIDAVPVEDYGRRITAEERKRYNI